MDTARVDICYRPLRIGWAIHSGDRDAFRRAVRLSYTLWGGRFNPILVVDREEEACRLIDVFRVDVVFPIGDSDRVKHFPKLFPYLIQPFFNEDIFIGESREHRRAQLLDIHNALVFLRDRPEWRTIKDNRIRIYSWDAADPLGDIFLLQFGEYPNIDEIGIDYRDIFLRASNATEFRIDPTLPITKDASDHPNIAFLSRNNLQRHYSVEIGWDTPGFFLGDATNLDDLISYWNLRAADIPLWFVDKHNLERYKDIIPAWERRLREMVTHRRDFDRQVAVWSALENRDEVRKPFGDLRFVLTPVSADIWNGRNVRPPMMSFNTVSTLGAIGQHNGKPPRISFPLGDKPFCGDTWFHTQHLVASVSFIGGLYGDEQHTLVPPFIPELNEFYARAMHFGYNKLRIESERVGLVIDAADTDTFLHALPVADLMERIFDMAGLRSKVSSGGLIVRQLLSRLGGLQGARAFKIPGVRRLLKTHGPMAAFTKKSALELIGSTDSENPDAKFENHADLFFGHRQLDTLLTPGFVFSYLVEKGLFRIGAELTCPSCRMANWIPLDVLKQEVICELCGDQYDTTPQLVAEKWHYRRSGVLGAERNAQGAVPVALTLQQLDTNLIDVFHTNTYSPSLDLAPKTAVDLPPCEVDFVWMISRRYPRKTVVILGECKDQGPVKLEDFAKDIENLGRIAGSLPRKRFKTFVLLSKLSPFTADEIHLARNLNDRYRKRVILLTARELEPYHIYERTKLEFKISGYGGTPEEMALATAEMYFKLE
jgi:hypothetical protein